MRGIALSLTMLSLLLVGCSFEGFGKSESQQNGFAGSEGLTMQFLNTLPPEIIVGDEDEPAMIEIEARNRGTYPQIQRQGVVGKLWLSGYDPQIVEISPSIVTLQGTAARGLILEARSPTNTEGGFASYEFPIKIKGAQLSEGKYAPTITANMCYAYGTYATPQVCISNDPYALSGEAQVCSHNAVSMQSQGAPIAITKVEQAVLTGKMQFKITFKNVGRGDVFKSGSCLSQSGVPDLRREQTDKVKVTLVKLGETELTCKPLDENRHARIIDGVGYVLCDLDLNAFQGEDATYVTPLEILLEYEYRQSAQMKMNVRKLEGSELGSSEE